MSDRNVVFEKGGRVLHIVLTATSRMAGMRLADALFTTIINIIRFSIIFSHYTIIKRSAELNKKCVQAVCSAFVNMVASNIGYILYCTDACL